MLFENLLHQCSPSRPAGQENIAGLCRENLRQTTSYQPENQPARNSPEPGIVDYSGPGIDVTATLHIWWKAEPIYRPSKRCSGMPTSSPHLFTFIYPNVISRRQVRRWTTWNSPAQTK